MAIASLLLATGLGGTSSIALHYDTTTLAVTGFVYTDPTNQPASLTITDSASGRHLALPLPAGGANAPVAQSWLVLDTSVARDHSAQLPARLSLSMGGAAV